MKAVTSLLLLALLGAPSLHAATATMPAVRMQFLDADTGAPVDGAVVLFEASQHHGTLTGHGGTNQRLFVVEGETDAQGRLELPPQAFEVPWLPRSAAYDSARMTVIKPGYALHTLRNERRIIGELQDVTNWEHQGKTVKLKLAASDKDLAWAAEETGRGNGFLTMPCGWRKAARFLLAQDRLVAEWDRRRAQSADPALRYSRPRSLLRDVIAVDKALAAPGCGSPAAYFEPLLR